MAHLCKRSKEDYFPFTYFAAEKLLEQENISLFKWSPAFDDFYIEWVDKKTKLSINNLHNKKRVLFMGVEGSGKTREAVELIKRLDTPKGSFLIVVPTKLNIEELLDLPANLSSRNIIIFFDNLDKLAFVEGEEVYELGKSFDNFSKKLTKVIDRFEGACDNVIVVATIKTKTDACEILKKHLFDDTWKNFFPVELSVREKNEAIQYYDAVGKKFPNISLYSAAVWSLAERYDGTFSSIREYLQIKNDFYHGKPKTFLDKRDINDFSGVFPRNWEEKYYGKRIKGRPAFEAIFAALSIISQARVTPYEKLVIALSAKLMHPWFLPFVNELRVKSALKEIYPWVRSNGSILKTSDAYIKDKGTLSVNVSKLSKVMLGFSLNEKYKYSFLPDLISFALLLRRDYKNYDLALEVASRAYDIDSENPRVLFALAIIYDKLEKINQAIRNFERVVEIEPDNGLACSYLASMYLKRGNAQTNDFLKAEELIKKAISFGFARKESLATYGAILSRQGKLDEAFAILSQIIKIDISFGYAWSEIGQVYSKQVKYQDAYESFIKAKALGFQDPNLLNGLGMAAKHLGKFKIARDAFLESTKLNQNHPMPWRHLGEIYIELEGFNDSIKAYKKSLNLDDNNALAWSGFGQACSKVGKFKESIFAHNKAIELGDTNYTNYYGLGKAYYGVGRIKEAIDAYIKSVKINSNSPARYALMQLRHTLSKDIKGEKTFTYLLSTLEKENILLVEEILEEAGRVLQLAESGDINSVNLIERVLATHTNNAQVYNMMSSAYRHLKKYPEAIAVADKATIIYPELASTWYTLGRAYEESKNYVESAKHFRKALEIKPDYSKANEALDRLKNLV